MIEKPTGSLYDAIIGGSWVDIDEDTILEQSKNAAALHKSLQQEAAHAKADIEKYTQAGQGIVFDHVSDIYKKISSTYDIYGDISSYFSQLAQNFYNQIIAAKKEIIATADQFIALLKQIDNEIEHDPKIKEANEKNRCQLSKYSLRYRTNQTKYQTNFRLW